MERHNRFDEAIKGKLGALEDEPSARVWSGVQGQIGSVRPPQASVWPMRIAAAVALLCTVGLGWYLLQPDAPGLQKGMALREQSGVKRIVILPLDREGKTGNFFANEAENEQQSPQQGRKGQLHTIAPQPQVATKDSLKPLQQLPPSSENGPVEIVHQEDAPQPLKSPAPIAPDQKVPQTPDHRTEVRTEIASASSPKRTIKMPEREDFSSDNLKRKSGAILGAITNGANSFLGLDANYDERRQDDLKLTAFNADFGLFKIKKVRTVKN